MTHQETYDKVVTHLRRQGTRSLNTQGRCMYRNGAGLQCAAGCLIPDKDYYESMEGNNCSHEQSLVTHILLKEGHDPKFVQELQEIHDWANVDNWEEEFFAIAEKWNLVYTAVPMED